MNSFYMIVMLALLGSGDNGQSASKEVDCRSLVLEAYSKISTPKKADAKESQLLEYKATTFYRVPGDELIRNVEAITSVLSFEDQVQVESNDTKLVKNHRVTVAVLKGQKQILIADAVPDGFLRPQFEQVRNTILQEAKLTSCQVSNGKVRVVTFNLTEELKQTYQIASLKFWVDPQQKQIKKMDIQYSGGRAIEKQTLEILRQETVQLQAKRLKDPLNLVLDAKGKLLPIYRDYNLTDTRSN